MNGATPPPLPESRRAALPQAASINRSEMIFRVVVSVVSLAALGLAWWTLLKVLVPIQKQSRDLGTAVSLLTSEIEGLERKWTRADVTRIRQAYDEVQSRLFGDRAALEAWLGRLDEEANRLGLDLGPGPKIDLVKATPQSPAQQNLDVIPAKISLEIRPKLNYAESPYQRVTRLAHFLATESQRADLTEMSVVGGPNSVLSAVLILDLWAGETEPTPEAATPNPRQSK